MEETLENLLRLSGVTDDDFAQLRQHTDRTQSWVEDFVQTFYDTLYAYPATAAVFKDGERADREKTLRDWYLELTAGRAAVGDAAFWRRQWIVGLVHIKRHVENSFMMAMMSRVQQIFLARSMAELPPAEAQALYGAFKRITDVVAGLVAEGYRQGYADAVADITGMRGALMDRMADVAVDRLLSRAREQG